MIDATYFQDQLPRDAAAVGKAAIVEVRVQSGQYHRVRAVLEVKPGYVVLERYEPRGEQGTTQSWHEQVLGGKASGKVERAIVPYESILDVVIAEGGEAAVGRIGFGG